MFSYPPSVVRAAAERIRTQGPTPTSPGVVDSTPKLCLAAALAWAGLRHTHGPDVAAEFACLATGGGDRSVVRNAYRALGWNAEECDSRMQQNDSFTESSRQHAVLAVLEGLLPPA